MRKAWGVARVGVRMASLLGCAGDTVGGSWASCPSLHWSKGAAEESSLLADLRQLRQTSGFVGVKEHRGREAAYWTVFMRPGAEREVREALVDLGGSRVDTVPRSARILGARN